VCVEHLRLGGQVVCGGVLLFASRARCGACLRCSAAPHEFRFGHHSASAILPARCRLRYSERARGHSRSARIVGQSSCPGFAGWIPHGAGPHCQSRHGERFSGEPPSAQPAVGALPKREVSARPRVRPNSSFGNGKPGNRGLHIGRRRRGVGATVSPPQIAGLLPETAFAKVSGDWRSPPHFAADT